MKRFFIIALCSLVIFSSCDIIHGERIDGTGNVIKQERNASNFSAVSVSSSIELYIKQDSVYSVKVETDDNLQQYIIITEDNGVLRIKQKDNTRLDPTGKIKIFVSAPRYKSLEASGACDIIGENKLTSDAIDIGVSGASSARIDLRAAKVIAELTGASSVELSGETKDIIVKASGSSNVKGFDLKSEKADIDISGACRVEVYAEVNIEARASGASEIRYKGAATIDSNTSGASSAKKVD